MQRVHSRTRPCRAGTANVKTLTLTEENAMSWEDLKVMMVKEYCPRSEMQKLEQELWEHTMKGSDIATYTSRFNELVTLCLK